MPLLARLPKANGIGLGERSQLQGNGPETTFKASSRCEAGPVSQIPHIEQRRLTVPSSDPSSAS